MSYFKKPIKKGAPISSFDMADGLTKIDEALSKMSVHNGHVDRSNGIPKIIVYDSGKVPDPPEMSGPAEWVLVGVIRKATSADVAGDSSIVLNQPLVSYRYVWAGSEISFEKTVPKQCPETSP
jgi:hypothetical protein